MNIEASSFESSEMLATFLASTPLLEESCNLCCRADATAPRDFIVNRRSGDVSYVAFSGVQMIDDGMETRCREFVTLESDVAKGIFNGFHTHVEGEDPVTLHAGLLQLFLAFYNNPTFQHKMLEIVNESKSVVFTGHSLGGSIASLSALWLLSTFQNTPRSHAILCITFGSPMLGNEAFSRAILHERWAGNFCHIVAQHDIVPRLIYASSSPLVHQLHSLFKFWHSSMTSPYFAQFAVQLSTEGKAALFHSVLCCLEAWSGEDKHVGISPFWPFGSYMFCTKDGAICLDNPNAIVKLLYLLLANGTPSSCIEDHLKYDQYVAKISWQHLMSRNLKEGCLPDSSYDVGISLALQSAGISSQESVYGYARNSLRMVNQVGCRRNLNNAKLAVDLSKINPLRAQIEWFKAYCEGSDDQMGYYDSFKRRGASKRGNRVNINRIRLALFWNKVIHMLETNQLPYDFHKQAKYVNASQFYKLLVEPLEIAEYYRTGMHRKQGHYIEHGREKRFRLFDKWWRDRKIGDEENSPRSKFASLTQDSCFWARVEEARDWIYQIRCESDTAKRCLLLEKIEEFGQYAGRMIDRKEVSIDVLAQNSSYNLFVEEWRELKPQLQQLPPQLPHFQDGNVVP